MQGVLARSRIHPENDDCNAQLLEIRQIANELMDIDKHYQRKEHALFSYLEKHGITGPSKVMWAKDDEVRLTDEHGNSFAIQSASGAVTIDAKGSVTIKAPSITLQSSGTLAIKAGATLTLQGALVNIN